MDLVAGHAKEILLALEMNDLDGLEDRRRFPAHVALGGGLDPTWQDLYAEAIRGVTDRPDPTNFLEARIELAGPGDDTGRTIERVDPDWIDAVARIRDGEIGAIAAGWIDLLEEELGDLPREEKPWIRELAGRLVAFCRAADHHPDVRFAWSLR